MVFAHNYSKVGVKYEWVIKLIGSGLEVLFRFWAKFR